MSVVENATQILPIEAIDWNAKKKEIVFFGRLTRIKRVDHAIRVFSIFHAKFPEYSMNIIGNPQDMAYVTELQELVQAL